jgi:hypothetical protein
MIPGRYAHLHSGRLCCGTPVEPLLWSDESWHADSVLAWGPEWRRYILVALVESTHGERMLRKLVGVAEDTLRSKTN